MTGLPEYRNGGLLLDLGLLEAKYSDVTGRAHKSDEEVTFSSCACARRPVRFLVRFLVRCLPHGWGKRHCR